MNSNHDYLGNSLPVFPSRTNLKLHNISVTPTMIKKVITNLDLSKVSSSDCIPVVVLNNCWPELFYMLAEFFNKCLKGSFFQVIGRFQVRYLASATLSGSEWEVFTRISS